MSYESEFWELQRTTSKKKKKEEEKTNPKVSNKLYAQQLDIAPHKVVENNVNSGFIAPILSAKPTVTSRNTDDDKAWYEKILQKPELFDDGYQVGDIAKTILGTTAEFSLNVVSGAGNFIEGITDTIGYGIADVSDALGADDFANSTRERVKKSIVQNVLGGITEKADRWSVLGDTSDAVAQGLGMIGTLAAGGYVLGGAGLGTGAVSAITSGLTGLSGVGSGMSEAYQGGATDSEARVYGVITGASEALSELMFGGLGKVSKAVGFSRGLLSFDDVLAKKVSNLFSNQIVKNLAEYGIKSGAEGFEEVVAGIAQGIGKKITYMSEEELGKILKDESLLEQFVVASVTSNFAQASGLHNANKAGTDFVSGLNENEQKVVDRVVEDRIAEEKEKGNKVSNKTKNEIYDAVIEDLDKGYIDTDTIESILGGEEYETYKRVSDRGSEYEAKLKELIEHYQAEYDSFSDIPRGEMSRNQINREAEVETKLNELKAELEEYKKDKRASDLKTKLSQSVFEKVKDGRLSESYREIARHKQNFEADTEQYENEYAKRTVQNAIDYRNDEGHGLDNTNASHDFIDLMTKYSADREVEVVFTTTKGLAELKKNGNKYGIKADPKKINAFVSKEHKKLFINMDTDNNLYSLVGHEVTHTTESAKHYEGLLDSIKSFIGEKEFDELYKKKAKTYEDFNLTKLEIEQEIVADFCGERLLTDYDFVKHLAVNNQNIFQKAWDSIKHLYKMATAGSKEARQLERVKRNFEKAYKEAAKTGAKVKGTKNSLSEEQEAYFKDSKVRDENGNLKVMYHGTSKGGHTVFDTYGSKYGLFGQGSYFTDNKSVAESYTNKGKGENKQVYETYLNITNPIDMDAEADVNAWAKALPEADFSNCTTNEDCYRAMEEYFEDEQYSKYEASEIALDVIQGMGYDGITHIGGGRVNADGTRHQVYIAFEPEQIKNIDNIAPTKDADIRYSLTETDNKYLSAVESGDTETAQKMVDEAAKKSGYTVKGLHATNADFTVFDINKTSENNFHGKGIYFTNSTQDVEYNYENHEGPDPWWKIEDRAYELAEEKYGFSYEDTLTGDADIIDKLNECYDEAIEEFNSTIHRVTAYLKFDNPLVLKKGESSNLSNYDLSQYDGIIDEQVYENIGHAGMDDNTVHYVVFNPRNIKSADAVTYDDNGNVIPLSERFKAENNDIRYSLDDPLEKIGKILYDKKNPLSIVNRATTNNNSSLKWVYDAEIFSYRESELFHDAISEINTGKHSFGKNINTLGEYMIPIDNKIVFTDGNYDLPYVREIIEVVTDCEDEFQKVRERIFNVEKGKSEKQDAVRTLEQMFGKGFVITYRSGIDGVYDWQNGQRKGKSRSTAIRNCLKKQYRGRNDKQSKEAPINEIAPIEASSTDGVFFDAKETKFSLSEDSNGRKLSKEQQDYFKNVSPLLKDESGNIKRYYHGTARGDRVGTYFNPERATSGPMAFFTDNPEIAENYSKSKADTSMSYDSDYDSYETQFRAKVKGMDMPLINAWRYLPMDARARIKDRAEHTHYDWDDYETLIYDEETTEAGGGFSCQLREARGNVFQALNEQWLNSGNLFNEEGKYIDVLKFIGVFDEFEKLGYGEPYYKDPYYREEKVFEVYLNVTNPFHTADVDEEFLNDARDWVDNTDLSIYESETADSDLWDKRSLDPYEWLDRLESDIENKTTHAWTSIPDVITDFLKEYGGYDGIVDAGGKHTGYGHQVVIPFYSEQIKNIDNETPTTDVHIDLSLSGEGETFGDYGNLKAYAKDITVSNDIAPVQETAESSVSEPTAQSVAPTPTQEAAPASVVEPLEETPTESNDAEVKPTRRSELHGNIIDRIKTKFNEKGFDFDDVLNNAKNLSTIGTVDNTPQRVMEKALGYKQGQALADETVNKVAQNESEGIKWLNSFTDRKNGVLAQISKQYNIKPGSKKSAAAQMYAEGFYVDKNNEIVEYGDRELAIDFPNARVRENIKGLAKDERIRQIYDETLEAINESRRRNLYPEIQRLDNYFLHFRAMEDTFSRLGLPFNPNDIRAKDLPTDLNGVTADLKPGQPYFASAMHRTGMRTSFDLLGGLEKYLTSAKNQIYHIDDIQTLRALRNYIADTYGQAKGLESLDNLSEEEAQERIEQVYGSHLSTFAKFLNEEANVLAGKTALIDRGLEGIIGRRGITLLNTINGQVGSNMVGGNVSSSLTNFLVVVQGIAKSNKYDFVKSLAQTSADRINSLYGKSDGFKENSPTIIRRKGAERFNRTFWQKMGDTGYVLMSAVDDVATEILARTKYNELTRKGMDSQQAHFETDKWVSRLMGDRSLGQMPQLYNSKMLGLVTKFQLEVRNQLDSQFYDTIQEAKVSNEEIENKLLRNAKTAAKVGSTFFQLAVLQHLFGKAFESVAGYNPAFDIIEVLIKTLGFDDDEEDEDTVLDNIEEGFFALLEDLPYTSTFTGGRIPISSALPIKEFLKGEDQYGNEKSRWDTIKETAPYYLLPTGYGQIKKTAQGLGMFSDKHPVAGSYTDSGNLRFPVDDTLWNRVQAGVFGQYANKNARTYFDEGYAPLKEKQIQEYIDVEMPIKDYWQYREDIKDFTKQVEKADYINGLNISKKQKDVLKSYLYDEEGYKKENPEKYAFLEKEGIGYLGYKELDEDTQSAWSWAFKHQDEYEHFKENGVLPGDYSTYYIPMLDFKDEDDKAYQWSFDNPEKATLGKVFGEGVKEYRKYTSDLYNIGADKDENGKSISGSAKEKKKAYIWSLDIDEGAKYILFKNEYKADDTYNYEIIDYLNSRDDISYDEMNTICEELGFKVNRETGYISWD